MAAFFGVVVTAFSGTAAAQSDYYGNGDRTDYSYRRPSVYRRHRNLINIAIGTGAGAIIGALIGGKKGAVIGAAAGAGGSALYTYKVRPKRPRYYPSY